MINLRIDNHPILGRDEKKVKVPIIIDGTTIEAYEGEPIAAALLAAGKKVLRKTKRLNEPRGIFCAIGVCTDCVMTVNGVPNIRTCIAEVEADMVVETQTGVGRWKDDNG